LRLDALAGRPPRRRRWRLRLSGLISLLIHAAVIALLLVTIRRRESEEMLPPPAPVTMLFESGRRQGPTEPNPTLQATPSARPTAQAPPAAPVPLPTPPVPPAEQPPPPPAPKVETPPVETPAPPPPSQQAAPAAPPVEVPPPPAPPPPPVAEEAVPLPPPPPPVVERPTPTPRPPPVRQATKPPTPQKPSDFPAPMDFSFGKPLAQSEAQSNAPARAPASRHIPGTIDMSLGPAAKGTANPTPYSDNDDSRAGTDYRNLLSAWVAAHAYYPEQARRDGDEGDARVHVLAGPDGHVKEVDLVGKSGSMWLDLALLALFRDQNIPPYPGGGHEPIEFNFIMHYVLIRR
jgi:periplasmic protein TonB